MDRQCCQVDEDEGSLLRGKVNRDDRENRKISGCPPDQLGLHFPDDSTYSFPVEINHLYVSMFVHRRISCAEL